jgi:DNA-binding NarL/FixJ family response regulator
MTDQERASEPPFEIRLETPRALEAPLNGRASHGEPSVSSAEAATRLRCVDRDALQPQAFELSRLWFELCAGSFRFRDTFATDQRYFALIERVSKPRPLRARQLNILERVLLGQIPKVVAIEMNLAISTVAAAMQTCLKKMGLSCRLSLAPVLLTMAVCAARRAQRRPMLGRLARVDADNDQLWVVSVRRPDLDFPVRLSDAEEAVLRQLLAGHSHAQISGERATSPRTVANQLATAFRKFGVSGRCAVVQQVIAHSLESQAG